MPQEDVRQPDFTETIPDGTKVSYYRSENNEWYMRSVFPSGITSEVLIPFPTLAKARRHSHARYQAAQKRKRG